MADDPTSIQKSIFVAAHDGGYEGHSLPSLAFTSKTQALQWVSLQKGRFSKYSVAEVPIYPEMPLAEWWRLESVKE